jgi:hypothetical protein
MLPRARIIASKDDTSDIPQSENIQGRSQCRPLRYQTAESLIVASGTMDSTQDRHCQGLVFEQ